MKYHYQYVSAKSVRIELIAEDRKETEQLLILDTSGAHDKKLKSLYEAALLPYAENAKITKINFMDFPRVALVGFEKVATEEKTLA